MDHYLSEVRNTIALNIDRIVSNGVSNDILTMFVWIFLVSDIFWVFKHALGQIDPGTALLYLRNELNRRVNKL